MVLGNILCIIVIQLSPLPCFQNESCNSKIIPNQTDAPAQALPPSYVKSLDKTIKAQKRLALQGGDPTLSLEDYGKEAGKKGKAIASSSSSSKSPVDKPPLFSQSLDESDEDDGIKGKKSGSSASSASSKGLGNDMFVPGRSNISRLVEKMASVILEIPK